MPFHASVQEWDADLVAGDPLGFPGYAERRRELAEGGEAVATGRTEHYAYLDLRFDVMGGTMGAAVGEKVVRAYDRARDLRLPVVVRTCTGGARLQEGMVALVQLARTASAARRHAAAGLLSLGVYGSPTTGGVYASFGSLVDLRAAGRSSASPGPASPRRPSASPSPRARTRPRRRTPPATWTSSSGRAGRPSGWRSPSACGTARCRPGRCRPGRTPASAAPGARCCGPGPPAARPASTGPPGCARRGSSCGAAPRPCGRDWPPWPVAGAAWWGPT